MKRITGLEPLAGLAMEDSMKSICGSAAPAVAGIDTLKPLAGEVE
jgi:hypothetical protein